MKRAAEDPQSTEQQQRKRPGPSPSNPSTLNGYVNRNGHDTPFPPFSPASVASPSPQHQQIHTGNFKKFVGCSRFDDYELEDKLGEGTFGEVHKARRKSTGELVALKRILMHNEKDGIPITALREIKILKQLSHINVVPLTDMATTFDRKLVPCRAHKPNGSSGTPSHVDKHTGERKERQRGSIYMVFPYMDHDLTGLLENPSVPSFQPPQVKLYLRQLLEGTTYLHKGILKIADFGLARGFDEPGRDYTNCVVTRWYRPPELLLGEKKYTTAIDLWGIGCVFAEMLAGKPLLPGPSDLDQLKLIFDLCGTPTEETMPGWRKLPDADKFDPYKSTGPRSKGIAEKFAKWGLQAVDLLEKLLMLDPEKRISAFNALDHDYFWTPPMPAEPSSIPVYESSHEYDKRKGRERPADSAAPQQPSYPPNLARGASQTLNSGPSHGNRYNGGGGSGAAGRGGRGNDHHNGDSYRYGGGSKDDRDRRDYRDGGHHRDGHRERERDRERYGDKYGDKDKEKDKDKDRGRDRSRESRDRERGERAESQSALSATSGSSSQAGRPERQVHALPPKPATVMVPALPPRGV
ncbi:kinase-like domain-containing protein [Jimgerdemannia flammicorona]|uniref:Kinase-like domain-containing protein n=1 Tax=Jimgerdemannia flammicorona TaxID=994334 RepID=A0A433QU20_9FUNG|nr:kinase-like domain-containing protein [Jimgerdemannia flammicorona]